MHHRQDYTDTFLAQGKPVFNVEYEFDKDICDGANDLGIDTILKVCIVLLLHSPGLDVVCVCMFVAWALILRIPPSIVQPSVVVVSYMLDACPGYVHRRPNSPRPMYQPHV